MGSKSKSEGSHADSPGKIFIGGLPKDTTYTSFNKHFGNYGEIVDSVIMKDRVSGQPRGFGFITYADPSVVDKVMEEDHIINGKQVEIKRTIPKGGGQQQKDFKTKKVFVGGIPSAVTDDELKNFFSEYGTIVEHQIIRDHETSRSRGFGFVVFDDEEVVDELLSKGNMIDFAGTQVEVKKAEPKKPSNPPSGSAYGSNPRGRSFGEGFGHGVPYGGFDASYGPGPGPYRTPGGLGRLGGGYGGYGPGPEFAGGYGGYGGSNLGAYRGDPSLGYPSRYGSYGGGFSEGYGGNLGGYGRGDSFGGYGGSGFGNGYESGPSGGYGGGAGGGGAGGGGAGGGAGGGMYGKGGYSGNSRYHPYSR